MESDQNYRWLYYHFIALGREFKYRRNKIHATISKLAETLSQEPKNIPKGERTEFVQAFSKYPECMVEGDPVQAYRNYYMAEKRYFAKWEKGVDKPAWWLTQTNESHSVFV